MADFNDYIESAAAKYGVPPAIVRSVVDVESRGNPRALGKSGDVGLMQLTPVIYKSDKYKADPWNPEQNINSGTKFLSDLYKQYGNWKDALAHYNAGNRESVRTSKGYAYADKVLAGVGGAPDDKQIEGQDIAPIPVSGGGVFDVVKDGVTKMLGLGGIDAVTKPYRNGLSEVGSTLDPKYIVSTYGGWVLAILLIIFSVWRLVK